MPSLPRETLRPNNTISVNWVMGERSNQPENIISQPIEQDQMIEATGWIVNEKNQIVLIASQPAVTVNQVSSITESCIEQ